MTHSALGPIAVQFPARGESNELLGKQFPRWNMPEIYAKTGVANRWVAGPEECASDLGVAACEKLFAEHGIDRNQIDFLLFCTQTPDYPLPTTACLMQDRLGLPTTCGALDYNLGCSGFVYGLALADGLIRTGAVRNVLLVTAETYSKYIDEADRSLRTIFGDAAAATLVTAAEEPEFEGFVFGTDGSGGDALMVNVGGARPPETALQPRGKRRWKSALYMDGPSLVQQTVNDIPVLVDRIFAAAGRRDEEIDYYLMHQATRKMMDAVRQTMHVEEDRMPLEFDDCGNTVSSTLPILIDAMRRDGRIAAGVRTMLVGFGVGYSSAGCIWRPTK